MTDNDKPGANAARESGMPRLTLETPDAILATIPHMLGFYPSQSLVVLGLSGRTGKVRVTFRYDLPDPPDSVLALDIAEHAVAVLRQQRLRLAVLVGYGAPALVIPVLAMAMDALELNRIQLREALRADGGRYWSVLCDDSSCCPPEGRSFDPGSHPAAAVLAEAGLTALPDRAALSRTLLPPAGRTEVIRESTRRAEQLLLDLGRRDWQAMGEDPRQVTAKAGRTAVQRAIGRYREGGAIDDGNQLAWLAVLLADLRVRDDAWARMEPAHWEAHIRLWTDVVRGAATEYVPAPASLLGYVAWQAGRGSLAMVAIDRALTAQPGYSMAALIGGAVQAGLPPSAAKLPMSPSQVAASYATQEADRRRRAERAAKRGGSPATARAGTAAAQSGRAARPKRARRQ
jgi:Domain of unknown function (DUF4192)